MEKIRNDIGLKVTESRQILLEPQNINYHNLVTGLCRKFTALAPDVMLLKEAK